MGPNLYALLSSFQGYQCLTEIDTEGIEGVLEWYHALLEGRLPQEGAWPGAPIDTPAREALRTMDLVRFCKDRPELAEEVLEDILQTFRRQYEQLRASTLKKLKELEALERKRLEEERLREEQEQKRLEEERLRKKQERKHHLRGGRAEPRAAQAKQSTQIPEDVQGSSEPIKLDEETLAQLRAQAQHV